MEARRVEVVAPQAPAPSAAEPARAPSRAASPTGAPVSRPSAPRRPSKPVSFRGGEQKGAVRPAPRMRSAEPVLVSTPKPPPPPVEQAPPPERREAPAAKSTRRVVVRKKARAAASRAAPPSAEMEWTTTPAPSRSRPEPVSSRSDRAPPRVAVAREIQSEEVMVEVLKAVVTKHPEGKRLFQEIHRELEALRQLDNLRKF